MKRELALVALIAALGVAWFASRESQTRSYETVANTARSTRAPVSTDTVALEAAPIAPPARETVATLPSDPTDVADTDASTVDRTPRISGRVVDQDGAPVWNALVRAQACGHIAPGVLDGDGDFTGRDGHFAIELRSNARHWLWIDNLEYSVWRSWLTPVPDFAAGTRDLEIRLQRRGHAHIHVVDALTRAVLPSVELRAIDIAVELPEGANPNRLGHAPRDAAQLEHGRESLEAQDASGIEFRLDDPPQTVFCWAPGHGAAVVTLTSESDQTLPLAPCGSIHGAVTFTRQARETCSVWVLRRNSGAQLDEAELARDLALDDADRFSAEDLSPGVYDVFAMLPERFDAPLVLRGAVNLAPGASVELGALEIDLGDRAQSGPSLRLVLKLPPGLVPSDVVNEIEVRVNGWRALFDDDPAAPDAALRMARVPPGRAVCEFPTMTPALAPRRSAMTELGTSGERELVFDLSDLPLCRLEVHAAESSVDAWFFARYERGEAVVLSRVTYTRAPFTVRGLVRGGERFVVERRNDTGEVTWRSVPLDAPHASERALELHVP